VIGDDEKLWKSPLFYKNTYSPTKSSESFLDFTCHTPKRVRNRPHKASKRHFKPFFFVEHKYTNQSKKAAQIAFWRLFGVFMPLAACSEAVLNPDFIPG
jgi:hypothetical protein